MKITTIVLSVHNILFILCWSKARQRERGRKAIVIMTVIRISVYCTGLHGLATTFSCLISSVFFCSLIRFILELRGVLWIHGAPWLFFYVLYLLFFSSFYLLIFMFFCVSYQLTYVHLLPLKISITSKIPITISPQIDAKEPFKMPSKKPNPIFFFSFFVYFRCSSIGIEWVCCWKSGKNVQRTFCRLFQFEFDFLKLLFTYFPRHNTHSLFVWVSSFVSLLV